MTKICFFISSAIDIDNEHPLQYASQVHRTAYSAGERLRQTVTTVNSIKTLCPEAKIFVFDISKDYQQYRDTLQKIPNCDLEYIACEEISPDAAELCRTHISKGLCESMSSLVFMNHVKDKIKDYDYLVKISGRYQVLSFDQSMLTDQNKHKYFFKITNELNWEKDWAYPAELNVNGKLLYCSTHMYGVGSNNFDLFKQQLTNIVQTYLRYDGVFTGIDYECIFANHVMQHVEYMHIPWSSAGWTSVQGEYFEW